MSEFAVRIFLVDYYLAKPLAQIDNLYNEFNSKYVDKVPILRVYGSTPAGQKVCAHIHGVYPYFYVPFDDDYSILSEQNAIDRYLLNFATCLDRAINISLNCSNDSTHIFKIMLVHGKEFYGFRNNYNYFLKIFVYNPVSVKRITELLLNRKVMNKVMQPYEAHIPYNLQFFIDYNLYGMSYLYTDGAKFRVDTNYQGPNMTFVSPTITDWNLSQMVWDSDKFDQNIVMDTCRKMSLCELEVDICACDILNILEVKENLGQNPGLKNLWEEEKERRLDLNLNINQLVGEVFEERPLARQTKSEMEMMEKWKNVLAYSQEMDSNIEVNEFLQSSSEQLFSSVKAECKSIVEENREQIEEAIDLTNACFEMEEDDSIIQPRHDVEKSVFNNLSFLRHMPFSQVAEFKHEPIVNVGDDRKNGNNCDSDDLFDKTFIDLSLDDSDSEEVIQSQSKTFSAVSDKSFNRKMNRNSFEDLFDAAGISSDSFYDVNVKNYDGADETDSNSDLNLNKQTENSESKALPIVTENQSNPMVTKKKRINPVLLSLSKICFEQDQLRKSKRKRKRVDLRLKLPDPTSSSSSVQQSEKLDSPFLRVDNYDGADDSDLLTESVITTSSQNKQTENSESNVLPIVTENQSNPMVTKKKRINPVLLSLSKICTEQNQLRKSKRKRKLVDLRLKLPDPTSSSSLVQQSGNSDLSEKDSFMSPLYKHSINDPIDDISSSLNWDVFYVTNSFINTQSCVTSRLEETQVQYSTPIIKNTSESIFGSISPITQRHDTISVVKETVNISFNPDAEICFSTPISQKFPLNTFSTEDKIKDRPKCWSLHSSKEELETDTTVSSPSFSSSLNLDVNYSFDLLDQSHNQDLNLHTLTETQANVYSEEHNTSFIFMSPITKPKKRTPMSSLLESSEDVPQKLFRSDTQDTNVELSQKSDVFSKMKKSISKNLHDMSLMVSAVSSVGSTHKMSHLTILSVEIFCSSRFELLPNPLVDAIIMVCFALCRETDIPDNSCNLSYEKGIIYVSENGDALRKTGICCNDQQLLIPVSSEHDLLDKLCDVVHQYDVDILLGYETLKASWGYVLERSCYLNHKLYNRLGRIRQENDDRIKSREFKHEFRDLHCTGRLVLDLWVWLRHELTLTSYSIESTAADVLKERVPHYKNQQLLAWWHMDTHRHHTVKYWIYRAETNLKILDKLGLITRTSEFARIFGIEFYHVLNRGSQYRVESMILRLAKPLNLIALSPSVSQRSRQKAPECIPLTLEPKSGFYKDPVVVLDFQSLYPSIMIAYNYCYSTTVGKIPHILGSNPGQLYEIGCNSMSMDFDARKTIGTDVNISPNGVAFVKPNIMKGIISKMVDEILNTRIMIKKSMKIHSLNKALCKLLDSRQLGLKLIANVTYGYTAAGFSGRMPCVEVGDSIVRKARETLEEAIKLVNSGGPCGIPLVDSDGGWKGCSVIYGDTDSMFILMPNRTKSEAFVLGNRIADAITAVNPFPVKLKFEKVYLPCILEAKKRYVGFSYETPDQSEPVFDAKGIETVRRDNCGIVSKILERSLKRLFTSFDIDSVKRYIIQQLENILVGNFNMIDFVFAKEYHGKNYYRAGAQVPAFVIAKKLKEKDARAEPLVKERVPYVIIQGAPSDTLISCVRMPEELLFDTSIIDSYVSNIKYSYEQGSRLSLNYYIMKQILPPLDRALSLLDQNVFQWYSQMPKRCVSVSRNSREKRGVVNLNRTISSYFQSLNCLLCGSRIKHNMSNNTISAVLCSSCISMGKDRIYYLTISKMRDIENSQLSLLKRCQLCTDNFPTYLGVGPPCVSLDCPIFFDRIKAFQNETVDFEQLLDSNLFKL